MLESASGILLVMLGTGAYELISSAVKDHAKDLVKKLFERGEKIVFSKKEKAALEDAYRSALTSAYTRAIESLGKTLELTLTRDEIEGYRDSVKEFLKDEAIAAHLLEAVRDPSDEGLPDPVLLERNWIAFEGKKLPVPGLWPVVAGTFRKDARETTLITPQLREVLVATNLDAIRKVLERHEGVPIPVKYEQYVSVMRTRYANVELAAIAPATAEDPGTLVVTDIFEPQHVRENPPPVAITKDEFDRLLRRSGPKRADEEEIIATLEEEGGREFAERLKFQRSSYVAQPVHPVLDVIKRMAGPTAARENRLLVITGEPGSGKSTLLRYLLLGILDPPPDPDDPTRPMAWTERFTSGTGEHFPLLIELRDYHFTCEQEANVDSLVDYFRYLGETMGYGIDDKWVHRRLKSGPSLIMFDGLDEIFDPARREHVMRQIVGFAESYPLARVIVTSRPHGYREGILRPAGFAHYRLQDLDREQIERFVRAWFRRVFPDSPKDAELRIERVLGSIDRSPSIRWLAGNPLLLTIMCLIARERELPRERVRFYEQCLDVLVHQWDANNHLQEEDDRVFLSAEDKEELLRRIAYEMQGGRAGLQGNFIADEQLRQITREWFAMTHDPALIDPKLAAKRIIEGLWHRNYILCPRGPKLYGFLHRTFMELLTATEYVRRFEKTEAFTYENLEAVFREHGNDPEWSEVLCLICGEIGDEYAERLIRMLLTLVELPTTELTEEDLPRQLVLAIRCMGELRGISTVDELGQLVLQASINLMSKRGGEIRISLFALRPGRVSTREFLLEEFLPSVEAVGDRWPGRQLLRTVKPNLEVDRCSRLVWPEFLAATLRNRKAVEEILAAPVHRLRSSAEASIRSSALRALAKYWCDTYSRRIIERHATQSSLGPDRAEALSLLAGEGRWADNATRQLLVRRAVEDEDEIPRADAARLLAANELWADDETRSLLTQRAIEDEVGWVRGYILQVLGTTQVWADDEMRDLLTARALEADDFSSRTNALTQLATNLLWADDQTRLLLTQRAIEDEDVSVRASALEYLAGNEVWADDETRLLLLQRAVEDEDGFVRATALIGLAGRESWADDEVRQLVTQHVAKEETVGPILCEVAGTLDQNERWAKHPDTLTLLESLRRTDASE